MCWLMWDVSHTTFGGGRFSTASRESKNLLLFISRTRGLLAWSKNCSFRCCPRQGRSCFAVRAVPRPVIAISTNPKAPGRISRGRGSVDKKDRQLVHKCITFDIFKKKNWRCEKDSIIILLKGSIVVPYIP